MRVAVVAEETAHHAETEAAVRVRRIAELLAGRGHDVTVFCARWWEGEEPAFEAERVNYRAVVDERSGPARRLVTRLPRALRRFDPDVIHATHDDPFAVHVAAFAGSVLRTPLVVDWYDVPPASGPREHALRVAARAPDLVVTPSRLVETGVLELGRRTDGVRVIPTGVDMDAIRAAEPEQTADIVYSRRLDGDANLESLLLALAELRTLDWRTAVIGDGPERGRYEQQARDLRIAERVRFLGDLPVERRLRIFKGAHVFVHTAHRTPFALDLLRALACGCVGITEYHAESSAHELVERYDRGFRTTSESELVDAIRESSDLPREDVDERLDEHDEGRMLERYLDDYRRLIRE